MRYTLEFADSELRDVTHEGDLVHLHLAAASVRDEAGERGWLTGVTLAMHAAALRGDTAHSFGKIAQASLQHDQRPLRCMDVPGTLAATGQGALVTLALRLANGTQFVAEGHTLEATLADDARFTPDLSC
jgi:hypothetical protein